MFGLKHRKNGATKHQREIARLNKPHPKGPHISSGGAIHIFQIQGPGLKYFWV